MQSMENFLTLREEVILLTFRNSSSSFVLTLRNSSVFVVFGAGVLLVSGELIPTKSCAFFCHISRKFQRWNYANTAENISLHLVFASWAAFAQDLSKISGIAFARFF